jgi:hypothetical protein
LGRGLAAIRPKTADVAQSFLFYVVENAEAQLHTAATGTTFKTISRQHLAAVKVPMIPNDDAQQSRRAHD